ncbi:TRAP transporter small permease [Sporosarcina obsidiansis]|uniref:TRAP transporter small permease n=1 Tax=Sporosarcina obsidiansis TaxID=2660748 RepID=UPI00129A3999|nr:TRAP transporter small permease [Sporosarcina obsidiansis]
MSTVIRWIDGFNKGIKVVAALSLAIMSIVIVAQVISRYFFHSTFSWSEELARYLMILTILLGASLALRTQSLIGLEIIAEKVSPGKRRILKLAVYIVCLAFFIALLLFGISTVTAVQHQLSPALQISMSIPYMSIPIGATALILNSIAVLLELIKNEETIKSEVDL